MSGFMSLRHILHERKLGAPFVLAVCPLPPAPPPPLPYNKVVLQFYDPVVQSAGKIFAETIPVLTKPSSYSYLHMH
jgi:hypothetical protein